MLCGFLASREREASNDIKIEEVKRMGLIKLMFLPMKMLMSPILAPLRMLMWPFKMAFRFGTVMLLFAQLMVMLFLAAMFIMFAVMRVMKKMRKMGKLGKMHMRIPSPHRCKP